jgi:hypothetical protein
VLKVSPRSRIVASRKAQDVPPRPPHVRSAERRDAGIAKLGVSDAALGTVASGVVTTTRLVILPGRFIGMSSFGLEGRAPIVAPIADDIVRAGRRSGDCADDDWEDSGATAWSWTFGATGVALEGPAVR